MLHKPLLQGAAFVFSVFLIAVLAWLTLPYVASVILN